MLKWFAAFKQDALGATSIEYALIAGLASLLIVAGVTKIGTNLNTHYFTPVSQGFS